MSLSRWVERQWQRRGPFAVCLLPLAWIYCTLMRLRRLAYRRGWLVTQRLTCPVIVVGNLSVGGTGKTPLIMALVRRLAAVGYRPGVVSRGYGGRAPHYPLLVRPDTPAALAGDEPALIAREAGCAVAVDPDRVAAARMLIEEAGCDVILADDGLQHLRLGRDIEIVVIASDAIAGNGWCLPAGPLRESPAVLDTADFVFSRDPASRRTPHRLSLRVGDLSRADNPARRLPLSVFAGRAVHAVAGLGNPASFFASLRAAGLIVQEHAYPDHHAYRPGELEHSPPQPLVMTAKDAIKCRDFAAPEWWVLNVSAEIDAAILNNILVKLEECRRRG